MHLAPTPPYCGVNGMRRLKPAPGLMRFSCSDCAVEPGENPSPRYWFLVVNRLGPKLGFSLARVVGRVASRLGVGAGSKLGPCLGVSPSGLVDSGTSGDGSTGTA